MKRKHQSPTLFDDLPSEVEPLFAPEPIDDADLDADAWPCGESNRCTLDAEPARVMGRGAPYATIEPVDLNAEPIYCAWDTVAQVLDERDGAFVRNDGE